MNGGRKFVRAVSLWLFLLVSIGVLLFWTNTMRAVRIRKNHRTTEGTVIQLLPENHRSVVASYEVDSRMFTTSTSLPQDLGLPPFDELRIGDKVNVEYDPMHPEYGILGSAEKLLAGYEKDLVGIGIFLVFGVALIEFSIRRLFDSSSNAQNEAN